MSDFSTDSEGWVVADLTDFGPFTTPLGTYPVSYNATGGNPGGYISATDPSGTTFYLDAPAKFLGNQSGAYGKSLSWDMKHDGAGDWDNNVDVILVGGGLTLVNDVNLAPGQNWTTFSAIFVPGSWRLDDASGALATQADLATALASLGALRIRAEFTYGNDLTGLDNVILETSVPDTDSPLMLLGGTAALALAGLSRRKGSPARR